MGLRRAEKNVARYTGYEMIGDIYFYLLSLDF
jgi:hypothetical protein